MLRIDVESIITFPKSSEGVKIEIAGEPEPLNSYLNNCLPLLAPTGSARSQKLFPSQARPLGFCLNPGCSGGLKEKSESSVVRLIAYILSAPSKPSLTKKSVSPLTAIP